MVFCTNCGQVIKAPVLNEAEELTVLSYQSDRPGPNPHDSPPVSFPVDHFAAPIKKSNWGVWLSLLVGSGMVIIFLVGLVVAGIPLLQKAEVLPRPLFGGVPRPTRPNSNISGTDSANTNAANKSSNTSNRNDNSASSNSAAPSSITPQNSGLKLNLPAQIGTFKQTGDKTADAKMQLTAAHPPVGYEFTDQVTQQKIIVMLGQYQSETDAKNDIEADIRGLQMGKLVSRQKVKNGEFCLYKRRNYNHTQDEYEIIGNIDSLGFAFESSDLQTLQKFLGSMNLL